MCSLGDIYKKLRGGSPFSPFFKHQLFHPFSSERGRNFSRPMGRPHPSSEIEDFWVVYAARVRSGGSTALILPRRIPLHCNKGYKRLSEQHTKRVFGILLLSAGLWPIIFFSISIPVAFKNKKRARSLSRSQFYLMIAVAIFFAIATRWRSAFQNSAVSKHPLKTPLWIYCRR